MKSQFINLINYTEAFTHERVFAAYKKINRIEDTRENELSDINQFAKALIDKVDDVRKLSGYLLSKSVIVSSTEEFDLLRFSKKSILNIEIKAMPISEEEILKQLVRHEYLLNCIPGKREVRLFTYVVSEKILYKLDDYQLVKTNIEELVQIMALDYLEKDLLNNLSTEDFIISPYANIEKFYNSHYFLNSEQSKFVSEQLVDHSNEKVLLQGGPGTGKSLVLFDLAKKASEAGKKVLFIFCSKLENWQKINRLVNFDFRDIEQIDFSQLDHKEYDYIILDEAQRLSKKEYQTLIQLEIKLIFSVDRNQILKKSERTFDVQENLNQNIPTNRNYTLMSVIRSNSSMATFLKKFMDLNADKIQPMLFPKVNAVHFIKKKNALKYIEELTIHENFVSIEIPQYQTDEKIIQQKIYSQSKEGFSVIGNEFDKIIIPIDKRLTYEDDKLAFISTDEYPYLEQNGLYQAITRVKSELLFVIIDNIPFYEKLQGILTWKRDVQNKKTSQILRRLRKVTRAKVEGIAEAINCSKETYQQYERRGDVPKRMQKRLAQYYNVDSKYLIGEASESLYTEMDLKYLFARKDERFVKQVNELLTEFYDN